MTPGRVATMLTGVAIAAVCFFVFRSVHVRNVDHPLAEPPMAKSVAEGAALPVPAKERETAAPVTNASGPGNPALASGASPAPLPVATLVQEPVRNEPAGAAGPGAGADGSDTLSSGDIVAVVQREKPALRRTCWNADADADASPGTVKVTAKITIGKDGRVRSVLTTGADTVAGLSACIAREIRKWRFPKSSSETNVNVPFVLVRS